MSLFDSVSGARLSRGDCSGLIQVLPAHYSEHCSLTVMSRFSKADEATSWRRQTPLQSGAHTSASSSGGANFLHRPATASSSYSSRVQQQAPQQEFQAAAPRQPLPAAFSPVEAQANLEQRWVAVCQQGLQPTPQCNQQQQQQATGAVADGDAHAASQHFLHALKAASKAKTADTAWGD